MKLLLSYVVFIFVPTILLTFVVLAGSGLTNEKTPIHFFKKKKEKRNYFIISHIMEELELLI